MTFFLMNVFDKINLLFCIFIKNFISKIKNTEGGNFFNFEKIFITKNNLRNTKI